MDTNFDIWLADRRLHRRVRTIARRTTTAALAPARVHDTAVSIDPAA